MMTWWKKVTKSFLGSVTFYTIIQLPNDWELEFRRIARWSPLIGILMGGLLGLTDLVLYQLGLPVLTRTVLIVAIWVVLTGGLHLDGVIDAADGLAVADQSRRLEVMKDSVTGAFGVMAAVLLLLIKTAALSDLESNRCLGLMLAAGWGRWGQVVAIAVYPYLKPTGKGAFHQETIRLPQDVLLGLFVLIAVSALELLVAPHRWWISFLTTIAGCAIALGTGFWFYRQLGGHTGDTYGAVVEWTETFLLCLLSVSHF